MTSQNRAYSAGPIPVEALAFLRSKSIKPGFDYRDVWREEHATAFTVAKAMQIDVLESIHDALGQALAEGRTFEQFKKDLTPTLQDLGWWGRSDQRDPITGEVRDVQLGSPRRLKTIYNTNMRAARSAGQWQRIERTKASRPFLLYQNGPSREHRPEHVQWNGIILPVDHPFWRTHMPQNGWGCKCHMRSLSAQEAELLGGVSDAPKIETREWVNERTGEVQQVPKGIDPGFDFNPGQVARTEHAARVFGTKVAAASADVGSLAMQSAADFVQSGLRADYQRWAQSLFRHTRDHSGETRLVGVVQADVIAALRQREIQLATAAITIRDSELRHLARDDKHARDQKLPESVVLDLPARLADPQAILRDRSDGSLIYVFPIDGGQLAKVVVAPGYRDKARLDGKRERVRTNAIRTATAVQKRDLPENRFELIKGKL